MPFKQLSIKNYQLRIKKIIEHWKLIIHHSLGFTLVEVLVSIAIVGVVFGVIIQSTNALQKNSRDTQRKADLRNIQTALQQYYADQNFYPKTLTLSTSNSITSSTGNTNNPLPNPVKTYMSSSPTDPQPGNPAYCYQAQANISTVDCSSVPCHYYRLTTKLEGEAAGSISCGATTNYNFQLTPIP